MHKSRFWVPALTLPQTGLRQFALRPFTIRTRAQVLNPNELDYERCTLVLMKGIKSDAAVRHALSANQAIHTRPSYVVDLHDGDDGWWRRQCKLRRKQRASVRAAGTAAFRVAV